MFWTALQDNCKEEKVKREKDRIKNNMWAKVDNWLTEIEKE